ncbi:MAG: hypothetical protein HFH30_12645 [Eubacterium sp.]|nr:hypothetical protein [Eubacterium sp.]MCI8919900.1 hypothetical protein [Eubacterium sp.]
MNIDKNIEADTNDINILYRDMGQVVKRMDQLAGEIKKTGSLIDELAEKMEQLRAGSGDSVQLECETASVEHKLNELKKRRAAQETASACCRLYGIFGMDYSVSSGRLYYLGKPVKCFSDTGSRYDGGSFLKGYEDQQGELSVQAVRGSTGHVLYLRVYDY